METLDLHGVRHYKVDRLAENFILLQDLPVLIITGNSPGMQSIVKEVVKRHELHWMHENDWNLGSLVVTENFGHKV